MTRSFLFVPADSERKLQKAGDTGADALILDLEDAVRLTWDHLHVVPVDQQCLDRAAALARSQPVRLTA